MDLEKIVKKAGVKVYDNLTYEELTGVIYHKIEDIITLEISTYFPQVIIEKITTSPQEDYNTLTVSIEYQVRNTNINDTLEFNFA